MIEGFNYGLALQFSVMKNGEHLTSEQYIKGLFMNLFVHAYIRFDATRVLAHDALTLANDVGILNPISVI